MGSSLEFGRAAWLPGVSLSLLARDVCVLDYTSHWAWDTGRGSPKNAKRCLFLTFPLVGILLFWKAGLGAIRGHFRGLDFG